MDVEGNLPVPEPPRPSRKAAHVLLNDELRFQTDNVDIRRWIGARVETLKNVLAAEVFPELMGHEDRILQLLYDPADCFIHHELHRRSLDKRERYFDLQITAATERAEHLLFMLVDITQQVLVSHRLKEIKSVPALKTTPEEIQQNLDALEQWNKALRLLTRASQVLTATLNTKQVLEQLLRVAIELIGAEGCSAWLWDEEDPEYLVCQAVFHHGETPAIVDQRLHSGQGLAGWVAQAGRSAAVISAEDDPRFAPEVDEKSGFRTYSLLVVPLRLREENIGVLEVVNKLGGDFDTDDLNIAETLAVSASIAIENARLVEKLQTQTEDLQSRNEELDAFAHTVAHDLQNPLARILGYAEVLSWEDHKLSDKDQREALHVITSNAQKMSTIIHELLMLSSVRKTEVRIERIETGEIVNEALERIAHLLEQKEAKIVLPETWPAAIGYAPWIEEVWENYLSNALKYGGDPPELELGASLLSDGMVRFWVRDNGGGLLPEDQEKLFMPFAKLTSSGHGLGLSIVRRIVHKLGGEVGIESEIGKGSLFHFSLPAKSE
jgi:two-component system sensor histidine kinase/response regulator